MSHAWKQGPDDPMERYVYLAIADNANDEGEAFPSLPTIAEKSKLSLSTIRRAIASMEDAGWLDVIRGRGAGNRSQYHLKKVSEGKVSEGNLSERKLSVRRKKGITETQKGVTETNPPDPLIGVTTNKPSVNHQRFVLPDWVPSPEWNDFEEMRRKLRKPMTDKARLLAIEKLQELATAGHDPSAVLNQSILNSYLGLFEVKGKSNGGRMSGKRDPGRPSDAWMSSGTRQWTVEDCRRYRSSKAQEGKPIPRDVEIYMKEIEAAGERASA